MIDLATSYLGLSLPNPLVASAGPLCESLDNIRRLEDAGAAAVVLHSLFEEQITVEGSHLDAYLSHGAESYSEAVTYFPDMQSYKIGPDAYLEHIRRAKAAVRIPIIGSLNGISTGGWTGYARKFEEAGPPQAIPREQDVRMRLRGGRTGKRAVVCARLELTGLMQPFDLEVWYGERVAVLGSNGSGKSHFLRLLASGGTDPEAEHRPVDETIVDPVNHVGLAKLGARVRPGWFAQTHEHPELAGRTLLETLHRGDGHRDGMPREQASRALDRYELAYASEQRFDTLSGGQQARFQILLLELSGATLLLLDEPTDNLDLVSAEALEDGLSAFEGTVLAATHDRWFARGFDRYLVFGADGQVYESPEPVWDEGRVARAR